MKRFVALIIFSLCLTSCIKFQGLNWQYIGNSKKLGYAWDLSIANDGKVWILPVEGGLSFIDNNSITDAVSKQEFLSLLVAIDQAPYHICPGDTDIWITTFEGQLIQYNFENISQTEVFDLNENKDLYYDCLAIMNRSVLVWKHNWIKEFSANNNTYQLMTFEDTNEISQVRLDQNGNFYVLTTTGEYYKQEAEKWLSLGKVSLNKSEQANNFWLIDNSIWIATTSRLFRISGDGEEEVVENQEGLQVKEVIKDSLDRFWVFENNEIKRIDTSDKTIHLSYPANTIFDVGYDRHASRVYISSPDGIHSLDLNLQK